MLMYDEPINNTIYLVKKDVKNINQLNITECPYINNGRIDDKVSNIRNAKMGLNILHTLINMFFSDIYWYEPIKGNAQLNITLALGEYLSDKLSINDDSSNEQILAKLKNRATFVNKYLSMIYKFSSECGKNVPVIIHEYYDASVFCISGVIAGEILEFTKDKNHTPYWHFIDCVMDSYKFVKRE